LYELHLPQEKTDKLIDYLSFKPYREVFEFMEDFKQHMVTRNPEDQKEEDAPPLRASK
jgi:hypothetical protein